MRLSLLLDENVPLACVERVRHEMEWECVHVRRVGLESEPDDVVFAFARSRSMTVVTFDGDFSDRRVFAGKVHAGVVRIRIDPTSVDAVMRSLQRVAELPVANLDNMLAVVDASRIRVTEF